MARQKKYVSPETRHLLSLKMKAAWKKRREQERGIGAELEEGMVQGNVVCYVSDDNVTAIVGVLRKLVEQDRLYALLHEMAVNIIDEAKGSA